MLFGLFKRYRKSKVEIWKEFELFELFKDLEKAVQIVSQHQPKSEELVLFENEFTEELGDLEGSNIQNFRLVIEWFSEDGKWCELFGEKEKQLRKDILFRAYRWEDNKEELFK